MAASAEPRPNTPRRFRAIAFACAAIGACSVWWSWGRFVNGAQAKEARPPARSRAPVEVVNRLCPVHTDKPVARRVHPSLIVEWRKRKIGVCCDECIAEWRSWADDRRNRFVDEWAAPAPLEDW